MIATPCLLFLASAPYPNCESYSICACKNFVSRGGEIGVGEQERSDWTVLEGREGEKGAGRKRRKRGAGVKKLGEGTIVWQISQAKSFLIGPLSDENCEGLPCKTLRLGIS